MLAIYLLKLLLRLDLGLSFTLPPCSEIGANLLVSIQDLLTYAHSITPELNALKGYILSAIQDLPKPCLMVI